MDTNEIKMFFKIPLPNEFDLTIKMSTKENSLCSIVQFKRWPGHVPNFPFWQTNPGLRMSPPPKPVHVHVCIIHLDYYTKSTCNTCIYTAEIGAPHQKNKNNNNNPSQK